MSRSNTHKSHIVGHYRYLGPTDKTSTCLYSKSTVKVLYIRVLMITPVMLTIYMRAAIRDVHMNSLEHLQNFCDFSMNTGIKSNSRE